MGTLLSRLLQELDELHSIVSQLNPEEIMEGMSKITHLECFVNALYEGIQEIKKLLLVSGKNSTSSSSPGFNPEQLESGSPRSYGERGKATHLAPQFTIGEWSIYHDDWNFPSLKAPISTDQFSEQNDTSRLTT